MNNPYILAIINCIILIVAYEYAKLVGKNISYYIDQIKKERWNKKRFKELNDNMISMKESGEIHDWITIHSRIGDFEDIMVCRKTGWSPTLNGFIPKTTIELYEKYIQKQEELEQKFKIFKQNQVSDLSNKYNVPPETIDNIIEDVAEGIVQFTDLNTKFKEKFYKKV